MKKILKKIISVLALGGFILVGTVSASTYNNGNVDTNPATITKENF
jgi:CHASE3 domain sensor protein